MKYNLKKKLNIAFAGGSTGGHVVPISSVIQSLQSNNKSVGLFWFGEKDSLEERETKRLKSEKAKMLKFVPIISGKVRRKPSLRELYLNIIDLFKLTFGILQSVWYLIGYRINVIFCKGGFVSLPVVIAGWILRIKIIVHESDTKPGLSTRIASKFATKVFTGFPDVLPGGEYIGQILSEDLVSREQKNESIQHTKTMILVNCGSLGSASVHEALLKLFSDYPSFTKDFTWTILLGKLNAGFRTLYEQYPGVVIYDMIDQTTMGQLYRNADVSICRGGSTTLVEQHLFEIKQIIVPIPWTHDQFSNAYFFVHEYDDILLDQNHKDWVVGLREMIDNLKGTKKPSFSNSDIQALSAKIQSGKKRVVEELLRS